MYAQYSSSNPRLQRRERDHVKVGRRARPDQRVRAGRQYRMDENFRRRTRATRTCMVRVCPGDQVHEPFVLLQGTRGRVSPAAPRDPAGSRCAAAEGSHVRRQACRTPALLSSRSRRIPTAPADFHAFVDSFNGQGREASETASLPLQEKAANVHVVSRRGTKRRFFHFYIF